MSKPKPKTVDWKHFRVTHSAPFYLGVEKDPVKVQASIDEDLKYEQLTKTCRICGKVALYRVKLTGYCKEHVGMAKSALKGL